MCSNVSYRLKEHVTRRDSAIFHVFIDVIVICLKALLNSEELLFSISHTKKKKAASNKWGQGWYRKYFDTEKGSPGLKCLRISSPLAQSLPMRRRSAFLGAVKSGTDAAHAPRLYSEGSQMELLPS